MNTEFKDRFREILSDIPGLCIEAKAKNIKANASQIHNYLNGPGMPNAPILIRLARIGIDINWLLTGDSLSGFKKEDADLQAQKEEKINHLTAEINGLRAKIRNLKYRLTELKKTTFETHQLRLENHRLKEEQKEINFLRKENERLFREYLHSNADLTIGDLDRLAGVPVTDLIPRR